MYGLIAKRIGIGLLTVVGVSIIIFLGTKVLPGDAAQIRLGQEATPENVAALRARLGLDLPLWQQYWNWLSDFVRGDLGVSLAGDVPVVDMMAVRYQNTIAVTVLTALIGVPVSLVLGITAAMFPGSLYDRILTLVSVTLVAAPEFFTATLMVLVFVLALGIGNAVVIGSIEGMGVFELISHFACPSPRSAS